LAPPNVTPRGGSRIWPPAWRRLRQSGVTHDPVTLTVSTRAKRPRRTPPRRSFWQPRRCSPRSAGPVVAPTWLGERSQRRAAMPRAPEPRYPWPQLPSTCGSRHKLARPGLAVTRGHDRGLRLGDDLACLCLVHRVGGEHTARERMLDCHV